MHMGVKWRGWVRGHGKGPHRRTMRVRLTLPSCGLTELRGRRGFGSETAARSLVVRDALASVQSEGTEPTHMEPFPVARAGLAAQVGI